MAAPTDPDPDAVPADSGAGPDGQETYWQPFRYTPEVDEALCFSCQRWLPPSAFRRDAKGVPTATCTECEAG